MTAVPRRKPQKRTQPVAAEVRWPSDTVTPRVTTSGRVPGHPGGPTSALWEEALGRHLTDEARSGYEANGLLVALSVLTCKTLEELREELSRRSTSAAGSVHRAG